MDIAPNAVAGSIVRLGQGALLSAGNSGSAPLAELRSGGVSGGSESLYRRAGSILDVEGIAEASGSGMRSLRGRRDSDLYLEFELDTSAGVGPPKRKKRANKNGVAEAELSPRIPVDQSAP